MACGRKSTLAPARYGEPMTPKQNPTPEPIELIGDAVLMSLACQKCRRVLFSRSPEGAVKMGIEHAQLCETSKILIAELVTAVVAGTSG